jgi:TM2 domain-containing membrane protein YozV
MMPSGTAVGGASTTRRRAIVAVVLSGLFPGLGQLYNREKLKALLFFGAGVVTGFGPLSPLDVDIDLNDPAAGLRKILLASLPFLAIAVWSVVDAYRTAKRARV